MPEAIATNPSFSPVDGTKGPTPVGISPHEPFCVGSYPVIDVNQAGTLHLGIGDNDASDNSGFFVADPTPN